MYNEDDVISILESVGVIHAKLAIESWKVNLSNQPLDLSIKSYRSFIYDFPIIIDDNLVGKITLVGYNGDDLEKLMQKYLGSRDKEISESKFSYDSYLKCYLTLYEKLNLPNVSKNFHAKSFKSNDNGGFEFEFRLSYGTPIENADFGKFLEYTSNSMGYDVYRFKSGINLQVGRIYNGWNFGERINNNIEERIKNENSQNKKVL